MDNKTLIDSRKIIITADDYGMSKIFNKSIEQLVVEKIISSVSVLVNRNEGKSLEGSYTLAKNAIHNDVTLGLHFESHVGDEHSIGLKRQINEFIKYFGRNPDYIDIHAPHKMGKDLDSVWALISGEGLPVRNMGQRIIDKVTTSSPVLIATGLGEAEIIKWFSDIGPGVHEIVFHPGDYDPNCRSTLNEIRSKEAEMARRIRAYIEKKSNMAVCNYNILR